MSELAALVSPAVAVISALTSKSKPKVTVPQPQITPRSNSAVTDAIAARRGSADNMRTGTGGAESATTAKKQLLGQ